MTQTTNQIHGACHTYFINLTKPVRLSLVLSAQEREASVPVFFFFLIEMVNTVLAVKVRPKNTTTRCQLSLS